MRPSHCNDCSVQEPVSQIWGGRFPATGLVTHSRLAVFPQMNGLLPLPGFHEGGCIWTSRRLCHASTADGYEMAMLASSTCPPPHVQLRAVSVPPSTSLRCMLCSGPSLKSWPRVRTLIPVMPQHGGITRRRAEELLYLHPIRHDWWLLKSVA